jgi:phosphate transport system substrate-binding protein
MLAACFVKSRTAKVLFSVLGFSLFLVTSFFAAIFVLPGIIGRNGVWLSFVLIGALYAIFILLAFKPLHARSRRIVISSVAGAAIILATIFILPPVYHASVQRVEEEIDLNKYRPFGDYIYVDGVLTNTASSVAVLDAPSDLALTGDLPRIDGATALYPLYSAFVRAAYPAPEPSLDLPEHSPYGNFRSPIPGHIPLSVCSTTPAAFENLIDGYADVVFLMGVSAEQRAMAREKGLEIILTPIGYEAFVFFVNSRNPAENLQSRDIRRIYSGEVRDWEEVGGGSGKIAAYQRPDESGSQTMLKQIMGGIPIESAPTAEIGTMMGMVRRVADYANYRHALGYSFLYYLRDMTGENKIKYLSIDGIAPTPGNIADGTYPFASEFYAVTVRKSGEYLNPGRTANIDALLKWLESPQAQYLVAETGYLPIN